MLSEPDHLTARGMWVMKALVEISRLSSWADAVHNKLISMLTSMFYQFPGENNATVSSNPIFLASQVDLIGGIGFILLEVPLAHSSASGDVRQLSRSSSSIDDIGQDSSCHRATEDIDSYVNSLISETSSMAALLLQGIAVVPMKLVARVPAILFYWPLIQLAGAATDNIALGVSVGSKGRGNLPGATSDIRAALLLLLIAKCTADSTAFQEVDGEDFFRQLLDDTDSRVAYYSSAFLLKRMMTEDFEQYQRMLQNLVFKAQQSNNEKLLENPYLQMRGILQLSNDLGT